MIDEDIQIFENKVKVIIKNSKDELLVCKRNGVIHFIGGKIEKNETCQEAAARELLIYYAIQMKNSIMK